MILRSLILLAMVISSPFAFANRKPGGRLCPIEREAVWKAIVQVANIKVEASPIQFQILGDPVSRDAHAELRVEGSRWNAPLAAVEFRLRCVPHTECMPFLVRIKPSLPEFQRNAGAMLSDAPPKRPIQTSKATLVRQGRTAKMSLQGDGFRLWIPVMCLQTGEWGDRIRVRDRNGRKQFLAEVVGPSLLKALTN